MNAGRRFRVFLFVQVGWLVLISALIAWWGALLVSQAGKIRDLENLTQTTAAGLAEQSYQTTATMIFWESATLYLLLVTTSALSIWFFWRDRKRSRSLESFFASVTHELRTPLTSIRLQAESIAEKSDRSCEDRELVQRLLEDTSRLESQVDRTLELARLEGGGALFLESIPLKQHIENILSYWKETQSRDILIQTDIGANWITADRSALRLIFKNLLENSIKHSQKDPVQISIQSKKISQGVEIIFSDNGSGFSGDQSKLGTLFYKGADSQGTGVGLYLVSSLTKQMGGSMQIKPNQNGFSVSLKLKEAAA